ncbi:MAG TPA: L,D-transpeptidase [Nocardioidaceae bacterium]|nr:L,D-transpeptidase [Nocardioidaceae bacterium]
MGHQPPGRSSPSHPPQAARLEVSGSRRPAFRPRYGRIAAAVGSLLVTLVSVLGGLGILPTEQANAQSQGSRASHQGSTSSTGPSEATTHPGGEQADGAIALAGGVYVPEPEAAGAAALESAPGVPADSGAGRRIVFDMTQQRVWLVDQVAGRDVVRRTYLVSGSVTDNLEAGSYSVYSRSLRAWGIDDSGSMRYMVRFASGDNAAIGFHDIPVLDGAYVQARAQLGTPQSHGCIRQWRPDARALWSFAPVGTRVVVV